MSSPVIEQAANVAAAQESGKISPLPLVAMVVGFMIGDGVSDLPTDMSLHAAPGAIVIGSRLPASAC